MEKQARREWHNAKWLIIRDSPALQLPERVIRRLIRARESLSRSELGALLGVFQVALPWVALVTLWLDADTSYIARISHRGVFAFGMLVLSLVSILSTLIWHSIKKEPGGSAFLIPIVSLTALGAAICALYKLDGPHRTAVFVFVFSVWTVCWFFISVGMYQEDRKRHSSAFALFSAWILFASIAAYIQYPIVRVLAAAPLGLAAFPRMLLLPFAAYGMGILPARIAIELGLSRVWYAPGQDYRLFDSCILFGLSVGFSFSVTLFALFVGHQLNPLAPVPQTPRMLLSNAFFDGATVVASLNVLEHAVTPRKLFTIPTAVLLNLVLGMSFACASLWVGIGSLTLIQVARVLIGHSVDGVHWDFGPSFWVMHSTFLPLLFYLSFVLLCWAAKTFAHRREQFHGRAKELDGLSMTASFLGVVSAFLALAGIFVKLLL